MEEERDVRTEGECKEERVRIILKKGVEHLKEERQEEKKVNHSDETKKILEDRRKAVLDKKTERIR